MNTPNDFFYKSGNDRVVLLFHGLTGHPYEMKYFAKHLNKNGFDAYCPVLPGHCCGINNVKECTWMDWLDYALDQYDILRAQYSEVYVSGLCLGAVLACAIAEERDDVTGVCALSTTLFFDGWEVPWYKFLIPVGLSTIFKFFYVFPEFSSYGIKNSRTSRIINQKAKDNSTLLNCIPMVSFHELMKIARYTMENVRDIEAPIILFHSKEDNLTSTKSAEFIYEKAASGIKKLIKLENCYHVITLDNEKENVAQKAVEFFNSISQIKNEEDELNNIIKLLPKKGKQG